MARDRSPPYIHPRGEKVVLSLRASPITDENGTIIGAIQRIRDITRHQQLEDKLQESEERFRALAENASDAIRVFNREGKIVLDTAASKSTLGYPPGFSMVGDPFAFIHPDDVDRVKYEFLRLYENSNPGVPVEFRIRKADRSYTWAESMGKNMFGIPGVDGIVTTTRFIDERKKAEVALQESEERYRTLIDQLPDYVIVHRNGILLYINKAATNDLFYKEKNPVGKPIGKFVDPEYQEVVRNATSRRTPGEIVAPYEIVITSNSGSKHTLLINGAQIVFEGKPATLIVLPDISVQKAAGEFMLRAKEALEERVIERTKELIQANMQLADEITARNKCRTDCHKIP